MKSRAGAQPGEYATEAAGLRWLGEVEHGLAGARGARRRATSRRSSRSRGSTRARSTRRGEEELGRGLAHVHAAGAPAFGAPPPGAPRGGLRLGAVELPAATAADWPAFYAEHRLAPLLRAAADARRAAGRRRTRDRGRDRAAAGARGPARAARAAARRPLGRQRARGRATGGPCLIDPAAYGGHREVDLAMLRLFGAPVAAHARRLRRGRTRSPTGTSGALPLWQLFPLLVHAVLFGGAYGAAAVRAARRAAA